MGLGSVASSKAYCEEMFAFHHWRQEKISSLLAEVDAKFFSQQLTGSFGSLLIILKHLVWAEKVWLGRVNHNEVAAMKDASASQLLEGWKDVTDKWRALVESTPTEKFGEKVVYFTSGGQRFENELAEIAIHLIDHSTYHIGQMMNAVRGFGIEPVSTNYIHYLRAKSQDN